MNKKINIIFRFDDYSEISNTNLENKILSIFKDNEAIITFGVVPFICDGIKEKTYKQNTISLSNKKLNILNKGIKTGTIDVALHGNTHQTNNLLLRSEFSGLSFQKQFEKIESGQKFLNNNLNIKINTFIPPWNRYDLTTLKVLEKLNFKTISAGTKCPYHDDSKLHFIPSTCSLKSLEKALFNAKRSFFKEQTIIVVMHENDFKEVDKEQGVLNINSLDEKLKLLKSNKNIQILSISDAINKITNLNVYRYKNYRLIRNLNNIINIKTNSPLLLINKRNVLLAWFQVNIYLFFKISLIPIVIIYNLVSYINHNILFSLNLIHLFLFIFLLYFIVIKNKIYKRWFYMKFFIIGFSIGQIFYFLLK